ncbi:DUF4231 domain-containing protein [Nannocystis pusilla]|nr:DUF4231 domain-containing protein [Nannocystis pusilla]
MENDLAQRQGAEEKAWRSALEALWRQQSKWSRQADELKRSHQNWTGPIVLATFLGVALGTLTPQISAWTTALNGPAYIPQVCSACASVLSAVAAYLSVQLLSPRKVQDWVVARSVSEALKSEGYLYAAGVSPYDDSQAAAERLMSRIEELEKTDTTFTLPDPDGNRPELCERLSVEDYIEKRVNAQLKYYRAYSQTYSKQLACWRRTGIGLGVVLVGLGALGTFLDKQALTVWMAVVTTAIATMTAYVYGSRIESLASAYFATAERLERLTRRWNTLVNRTEAARNQLILDCEAVLSAQNRSWSSEWAFHDDARTRPGP